MDRLELRTFHRVASGVLAAHGFVGLTRGEVPFTELSLLGDNGDPSLMRGYLHGRYRDRDMLATQLEYRAPLKGRFGYVAFAGAGNVAEQLSELDFLGARTVIGAGLRYRAGTE